MIYEIDELRQPVKKINRCFWSEILKGLNLKSDIIVEDAIEVIVGLGKYLHMKMQHDNLLSLDEKSCMIDKYTIEYVNMLNMFLYGIVK